MPQVELPSYWLHPEGIFPVQLVRIEDAAGQWGPQIKWTWETPEMQVDENGNPILDEDGQQRKGRVVDFTGCTVSAKSGLGKLLVAMGITLPASKDEAAAMNDAWFQKLVGKRVQAKIIHNLLADGRVFANIQTYAPLSGQKAAATAKVHEPPTGCPDPDYNHDLKIGDPGHDPFHSESDCPILAAKKGKKAA